MRGNIERECGEYDALWRALCDQVYPMRDALGVGDARRLYHQDLPLLTDMDLELDKLRARFRVCLEPDFSDRMWLLERIDRIEDEQARRAEDAWPPRDPADIPARPTRDKADAPQLTPQHDPEYAPGAEPPRPCRVVARHHDEAITLSEAVRIALEQIEREAGGRDERQEQAQDVRGLR